MNASGTTPPGTKVPTRNPWPVAIVLFFVLFISGMAAWITVALRNDMDLVRKDYYEQEILFQKQIDRVHRTATVAGATKLDFDSEAARLSLQLPAEHASSGATGDVHLYRPSDARLDRRFPLELSHAGAQTLDLSAFAPGLWKVQVHWTASGKEFFCAKEIVIARR